jgi:pimeloyl-ACP methyl ester carboxylesterase
MTAARALHDQVRVPVTLIYGEHDWSWPPEREANLALFRDVRPITPADTGHFAALEQPARVAEVLLASVSAEI